MTSMLLVDDNTSLARFTARHLRRAFPALDVTLAETCEGARRLTQTFAPNVLLVDQYLPDGDGTALAAELLRQHPQMHAVVTSAALPADADLRRVVGANVHALQKPFEVYQLVAVMSDALGQTASITAESLPVSQPPPDFDAHLVRNRLAALLAGIRAYSEELRHSASNEVAVRGVVADYEDVLVDTVRDLSRLVEAASPSLPRIEP